MVNVRCRLSVLDTLEQQLARRTRSAMVRAHFRGRGRFALKASAGHFARMGAVGACYAYCLYAGWWRGDARLAAPLGVCAWFVLANLAHDGSHCAVAASGRANELWALTGAPLELASFEAAAAELAVDFTPITDMRASADYRLQVAANLLLKYGLDVTGAPVPRLTGAGLSADDLRAAAPGAG